MKILLDSHTVLWAVDDPSRLGSEVVLRLNDPANDLFLSAGTVWELAIKVGLGKLSLSMPFRQWMATAIAALDATLLPITVDHADEQSRLAKHHGDPSDRLLVAQSRVEGMTLASNDAVFDQYGVIRVW